MLSCKSATSLDQAQKLAGVKAFFGWPSSVIDNDDVHRPNPKVYLVGLGAMAFEKFLVDDLGLMVRARVAGLWFWRFCPPPVLGLR